jgi:spore maturation protein CgeB
LRLLTVHPGPRYSVSDVYDGLTAALRRAGHELIEYPLGDRIATESERAEWLWRYRGKRAGLPRPRLEDAVFLASRDLPYFAARHEVDATLVVTAAYVHPDALAIMQRAAMPVGVVFTETPYDRAELDVLPYVRLAWTNERAALPAFRRINRRVHYFPCAFDPERHRPGEAIGESAPAHDVVFVGSDFRERVELLLSVDWTGLDLGLYGAWSQAARATALAPYIRDGVISNERAATLYRRAKVCLNLYRWAAGAESLNPRAVELAAIGAFQISDYRAEVSEVFGDAVPTFKDGADLSSLIRRWLADDAGRQRLAARLPAAVASRSFDVAASEMVAQLREVI